MSNIGENFRHLAFAFLCPNNRIMTMEEYGCDEWVLLEHPEFSLAHYYNNSGIELSFEDKKDIADFMATRCGIQITAAFLCPVNRHAVRDKYKCSDEDFLEEENQERLVRNFVENGGAVAFAIEREKRKKEEERLKEISRNKDCAVNK